MQIKKIREQSFHINSLIPLWPPWHAQYRAVFPALSKPLTPTRLSKHSLSQLRLPERQIQFWWFFFFLEKSTEPLKTHSSFWTVSVLQTYEEKKWLAATLIINKTTSPTHTKHLFFHFQKTFRSLCS